MSVPIRVVTKISSCQVNTTSRLGIKQLRISFGSIFLLFSNESSWGPHSYKPGEIRGPGFLTLALPYTVSPNSHPYLCCSYYHNYFLITIQHLFQKWLDGPSISLNVQFCKLCCVKERVVILFLDSCVTCPYIVSLP